MALIRNYMKLTAELREEYGPKSLVLMQVGAFYEVYGYKDPETGELSGTTVGGAAGSGAGAGLLAGLVTQPSGSRAGASAAGAGGGGAFLKKLNIGRHFRRLRRVARFLASA